MINERYGIAIAETLHYLKGISQEDINKIPNKFMSFLKENASQNYECNFDYTKPLKELNLTNETRGLIAVICLNYWCETEEEKKSFREHLSENEKKYQEELIKKYNNGIFKKKESIPQIKTINENIETKILPVQTKKTNFFKRTFNSIMKFFNIR